jgi:hypothetical protein
MHKSTFKALVRLRLTQPRLILNEISAQRPTVRHSLTYITIGQYKDRRTPLRVNQKQSEFTGQSEAVRQTNVPCRRVSQRPAWFTPWPCTGADG